MMQDSEVTLQGLLEAGVHFGHQSRKWNPKMKPYIYTKREGIHIIDLTATLSCLRKAQDFVRKLTQQGGQILFLATKKQAQEIIKKHAQECGAFYLTERWIGGLLTNFENAQKGLERFRDLRDLRGSEGWDDLSTRNKYRVLRDLGRREKLFGGVADMEKMPDALFIVDPKRESSAVKEANRTGVPVVALIDTNGDPDLIDYPIPGNDDGLRAIDLVVEAVSAAIMAGKGLEVEGIKAVEEVEADEFEGLSTRARNALIKAGFKSLEEVKGKTVEELREIEGIGEKVAEEIMGKL